MKKMDIRGKCKKNCIYNDNGRCDMYDDFAMPYDTKTCNNYEEYFVDKEDEV